MYRFKIADDGLSILRGVIHDFPDLIEITQINFYKI